MMDYRQLILMMRSGSKEFELQAEAIWAEVRLKTYRRAKQYIDWYPERTYIDIALRARDVFNPESASGLQVLTHTVTLPHRYDRQQKIDIVHSALIDLYREGKIYV